MLFSNVDLSPQTRPPLIKFQYLSQDYSLLENDRICLNTGTRLRVQNLLSGHAQAEEGSLSAAGQCDTIKSCANA